MHVQANRWVGVLGLLLCSCSSPDGLLGAPRTTFSTAKTTDNDKDGFYSARDCDDNDPTVYPFAKEICDGKDNNCDRRIPSNEADTDGDGSIACKDCDDSDATVYPDADDPPGDGVDEDCDGAEPTAFVDEDFESGTDGAAVDGTGCWSCYSGTCDEVYATDLAHGGTTSLATDGSRNAQLFCSNSAFGDDFRFRAWFYDDGSGLDEFNVVFQEEESTVGESGVLVGFNKTNCASAARYCAASNVVGTGVVATADLGARAAGWHEIAAKATYTATDAITWELCIQDDDDATDDRTCGALSTTGYPVGTFRLHHDHFSTWADEFLAWAP